VEDMKIAEEQKFESSNVTVKNGSEEVPIIKKD